ncbi:MAG: hypothetical protein IJJ34_03615, partial [Clostridia bacterium]|nr:hypothetical protein [Clostridia bacterium]
MFERKADLAEDTQERIAYYRKAEEKWQDLYEMTGERYYRGEAVNARKLAQKEARESSGEGGGLFRMFRRKNRAQDEEKAPEAAMMPVSEMPAPTEPERPKFVAPRVGEDPVEQEETQETAPQETEARETAETGTESEEETPQSETEETQNGAEEETSEEAEAETEEETPEDTEAETEEEIPDEAPSKEEETPEETGETETSEE